MSEILHKCISSTKIYVQYKNIFPVQKYILQYKNVFPVQKYISGTKIYLQYISERTLRNRLNEYGFRRRSPSFDINDVRRAMHEVLNGPGDMRGYRSMWHALRTQGLQVPRRVAEHLMRELDPKGCQPRRAKRLGRRSIFVELSTL